MCKLNVRVPLLCLLLLPFLVMFLPLQKRRAKKRNNKTQKTSATSGLLTVLRPSAKRKKNNSKERFVSRSEEHTSELQSLMRISYAVFCLKKKKKENHHHTQNTA